MTQQEITEWEIENISVITGWHIEYGAESDKIIFFLRDGKKVEFERQNQSK